MLNFTYAPEYSEYLTREERLSDSMRYQRTISYFPWSCQTTIEEFENRLTEKNEWDRFETNLENIRSGWATLEWIAWCWDISVILVKYYLFLSR